MRVTLVSRWVIGFALAAIASPAFAQNGALTGRVTDSETKLGVPGAQVVVLSSSGATAGAIAANEQGTYRIGALPAGTYTVVVSRIGYTPKRTPGVVVGAGQTVSLDLEVSGIQAVLNQVVVSGSRAPEKVLESPASIQVVGEAAIAARPSVTAVEHLKNTPGLDISQGGLTQSNVVARGFNNIFSGSMLMLQDYRFAGVPSLRVNVPFLFTGANEDIERIEVLLGPASALYGPNSANGVLHIITKSPFASQGTTVTIDGGERSVLRASLRHAQQLTDRTAIKFSGEYLSGLDFQYVDPGEPGTFPAQAPPGRAGQPNVRDFSVEKYTFEGRFDVRPDANTEAVTTIGFTNAGGGIELTGANGAARIQDWSYLNVQQRFRRGRFFAQAFANFSDAGNDDPTSLRGTYLLRTGQPIVDQSRVYVGQVQHGFDLGRNTFTYGADYIFTNPRTGNTINGANEDIDDVTEFGAYIQGTIPLAAKWDFVGAFRGDKHSQIENAQFSPRAAFIYKPSDTQNWRVTYNRAFQTPANFAFFLDLVQARNIGGSGFDIRATGNPNGHRFDRSCNDAAFGNFCMRSIYNGGAQTRASASQVFGNVIGANEAALLSSITAGLTPTAGPAAGQLAAAIVNGFKNATPTDAQVGTRVALITQGTVDLQPGQIQDIGRLQAGFNNTYELGYKGLIGTKGRLTVDAWFQQRGDVSPPAFIATPSVFFQGQELGGFLGTNIVQTLTPIITQQILATTPGITQAQAQAAAQQQATQIAQGVAPLVANNLARAPLGTITYGDRTDILATYASVGGETLEVFGFDVGYDWLFNDKWSVAGTYSWLSDTEFPNVEGGNGLPFMTNSPKHKSTLALRYANEVRGFSSELRGRYADAFRVNSGVFFSGAPIPAPGGTCSEAAAEQCSGAPGAQTYTYPSVPVSMTLDLNLSWRLPFAAENLTWSVLANNVLDNKVPTMAGVPPIGRLVMTRLSYKF
jgi:outer membrane receptor for ferrienterochelin and colicins